MGLLSRLSTLVASNGGMKPKQWGKVVALLAKDAAKVGRGVPRGWLNNSGFARPHADLPPLSPLPLRRGSCCPWV